MESATYTGDMLTADFAENTITFEIEGSFSVKAGKYYIFSQEDLQNFADQICKDQRENCAHSLVYDEPRGESQHRILNAEQPKTEQI